MSVTFMKCVWGGEWTGYPAVLVAVTLLRCSSPPGITLSGVSLLSSATSLHSASISAALAVVMTLVVV